MKRILIVILLLALCPTAMGEGLTAAEFEGGSISYEAALAEYQSTLADYEALGLSETLDERALAQEVLEAMVEDAILREKAEQLGLTEVSETDRAALMAEAQASYESQLTYYMEIFMDDGLGEADARSEAEALLAEQGQTPEELAESLVDGWWRGALSDFICGDVSASDEEIQAQYDALLTTQRLQCTEDPSYFDYLYMNDDLIVYYPEGMRYIKHILLAFDDASAEAYSRAVGEGTLSDLDLDAQDALFAPLADRVQAVENQLAAGEDFEALMRALGDDENMASEPYGDSGYIVRRGTALFVQEFVDAAFALEEPGDISGPVRTAGGVHFLLYAGDVPAGAVPLESVRDAVEVEALEQKLNRLYEEQAAQWVAEANPVYHPEYLLQ